MAEEKITEKVEAFKRYPLSYVLVYNGITVIHFLLGGMGIIYGYSFTWAGKLIGFVYLAFAFIQMYVVLPLTICPACDYYHQKNSRCMSGLNVISKRVWHCSETKDLSKRSQGFFCHNHLYIMSLVIPIIIIIHALIFNFSLFLLFLLVILFGLLLFRILIIIPKMACLHCCAKHTCPNAEAMGIY
jgi:hypothetical protein